MKNIHVLPTKKPRRLQLQMNGNFHIENGQTVSLRSYQNIYIPSDEEIKEGDWCILLKGKKDYIFKALPIDNCSNCKKIILTTDQDLIKDGVQAIDDEFLEWFVMNPSCEFVEIKPLLSNNGRALFGYKIIIPKEEPKFVTVNIESAKGEDLGKVTYIPLPNIDYIPKQETLEEAAEKFRSNNPGTMQGGNNTKILNAFKNGAKWQQERMYSEEEVGELLYNVIGEYGKHYGIMIDGKMLNDLFEQFKKK